MIWSVDQDTMDYFELDALYPNIKSVASGDTQSLFDVFFPSPMR
jgi:hypothetical protein